MGLDVHAFSKAASHFIRPVLPRDGDQEDPLFEDEGVIYICGHEHFEPQSDGYAEGFYRVTGESMGFRAGSYSGYGMWRRHLCRMALDDEPEEVWSDPDAFAGRPFVELINFSDCEGTFGPKTSAKLAADFDAFEERAERYAAELGAGDKSGKSGDEAGMGDYFLESYRDWLAAFEMAADDGFVRLC